MLGASIATMGAAMVLGTSTAVPYFGRTGPFLTLGGDSMVRIIYLLKWGNAVAFVGTALVLDRLARPDPVRRIRACLLWTVNPIMLFWMVGSGHADVYAIFFLVLAMYALRRSAFAAGLAGGAAVAVKASFLFPAAALVAVAWFGPARFRRVTATAVGLLVVASGGYLLAGSAAIHSLSARLGRKKDRYLPVPERVTGRGGGSGTPGGAGRSPRWRR